MAVAAYAPSVVRTRIKGTEVKIDEVTDYPFRGKIAMTVSPTSPLRFPLYLRIPAWTSGAAVMINGRKFDGACPGTYQRIDREWRPGDSVEINLAMPVRTIAGFNGSVSVERGPLVFSLRIGESWSQLHQTGPVTDWEVYPTSPWNYGLRLDPADPSSSFAVEEAPIARQPFNNSAPPVVLKVKGRRLPQWVTVDDSAAPPPPSPVRTERKEEMVNRPIDETITLIPYAAARLRITSFPVLGEDVPETKR